MLSYWGIATSVFPVVEQIIMRNFNHLSLQINQQLIDDTNIN